MLSSLAENFDEGLDDMGGAGVVDVTNRRCSDNNQIITGCVVRVSK